MTLPLLFVRSIGVFSSTILSIIFAYALLLLFACRDASVHFRGIDEAEDKRPWPAFVNRLYFSAVSLSTIGFGDIAPKSERAKLLSTAVSILVLTSAVAIANHVI